MDTQTEVDALRQILREYKKNSDNLTFLVEQLRYELSKYATPPNHDYMIGQTGFIEPIKRTE